MTDSISSNVANIFFTRRALHRHQKDTRKALKGHLKSAERALGHSKGTPRALLSTRRALEGHLGTQGTGCTQALREHLDTQALKALGKSFTQRKLEHSGTQSTYEHETLEVLYLAGSNRKTG